MAVAPVPALFEPAGGAFAAAASTRGPWDPRMMHGGAPSALLAHALEQLQPAGEFAVSRLTIEFLGGVPLGDVSVQTSLAKPGKRFQIVDATLHAGERLACLARAVRLRRADVPDAATSPEIARCRRPTTASRCRGSPASRASSFIPTRPRYAWSADGSAPATRSRGSACAGRCCRACRHRRWRAPPRRRTSPTG